VLGKKPQELDTEAHKSGTDGTLEKIVPNPPQHVLVYS